MSESPSQVALSGTHHRQMHNNWHIYIDLAYQFWVLLFFFFCIFLQLCAKSLLQHFFSLWGQVVLSPAEVELHSCLSSAVRRWCVISTRMTAMEQRMESYLEPVARCAVMIVNQGCTLHNRRYICLRAQRCFFVVLYFLHVLVSHT